MDNLSCGTRVGSIHSIFFALIAMLWIDSARAQTAIDQLASSETSSLLLIDPQGSAVISHLPDTPRIPASTLKILTALGALEQWGNQHRFTTDFYLEKNSTLVIKGYGDPFLVSEELGIIAAELATRLPYKIREVRLDDSYFDRAYIDGQTKTSNPYDSPIGALAANFNTASLQLGHDGVRSGESQTPLTDAALEVGRGLKFGKRTRVNLADRGRGLRHFAEVLRAKLRANGVNVHSAVSLGPASFEARHVYQHQNSRILTNVVSAMLQYSTNFIANQLFMSLGASRYGEPATIEKGGKALLALINNQFSWDNVAVYEGAGLSRRNQMSASQMAELLTAFQPHYQLLPEVSEDVYAKTGTLRDVKTYAGYIGSDRGAYRFVILINDTTKLHLRDTVLNELIALARDLK